MTFVARRVRNIIVLVIASALSVLGYQVLELSLLVQQYYTGWALVAVVVSLLLFGVKKRLSVLPLGSNASWAQWHYYSGAFLLVLFVLHVEFSIPDGFVELALTLNLLLVAVIGILGLFINRVYAKRLALLDEEIIYERITGLRSNLKQRVESALLDIVAKSKSSTLSSYYGDELANYFSGQKDFFTHLVGSSYQHQKRQSKLEHQLRYLNKDEADFVITLIEFVNQKNTLDKHAAMQSVLKFWGVLHAPIALIMTVFLVSHIVLVYAFRGAM